MATKKLHFSKRFKTITKKNADTLTFGEKARKISPTDAITTLLDRSDTKTKDDSVYDVISAFTKQISRATKDRYSNKRAKNPTRNRNKKEIPEYVEYLEKDVPKPKIKRTKVPLRTLDDDNDEHNNDITFEASSNLLINNDDDTKEPPKKKQKLNPSKHVQQRKQRKRKVIIKNTISKDYYKMHWNRRLASREEDIYPLIKQRRQSQMKVMDIESDHSDYWCFIDRDCCSFPISHHITSPSLNLHNEIIFAYKESRKEWFESSKHKKRKRNDVSVLQARDGLLLSAMCSYRDLFFCDQNYENDKYIKQALTMHFLSHILRNNEIRNANTMKLDNNSFIETDENDAEIRDSGFKRLSVVIITPFRENVRKFATHILEALPKERTFKNERYKRFEEEYGTEEGEKQNHGRGKEYECTFSGNIDDDFWCGISLEEKGVSFLQSWYYADILFISPLRLKLIFDSGKTADGRSVFDFFSSIEMLIMEQCDVIEMQNIQHLFDTLHKINWHPKLKKEEDIKQVNFNRLRYCFVDDVSQFYRQNIICTKYQTPKMKQIFEKRALNVSGRIKIQSNLAKYEGVLHKVLPFVKQQFIRYDDIQQEADDEEDINETRLKMYKKYMLPILKGISGVKILIFVSTYYDFLRLRRLYKKVESMRFLSEYTIKSDEIKYKKEFRDSANQNVLYLVITERYYFYNRIKCDGAACVFFYNLPQNKEYYYQILNWFDTKKQYQSYALYSKYYDKFALQRIVGAERMIKMLRHQNRNQIFV